MNGDLLPLLVAVPLLGAGLSLALASNRSAQRALGVLVLTAQLGLAIAALTAVVDGSTIT